MARDRLASTTHARDMVAATIVPFVVAAWLFIAWRTPDGALRALQYDPVFGWFADFRYHYLPAGQSVLAGRDAGQYFFYPPSALLLFALIGWLPGGAPVAVWAVMLAVSTWSLFRVTTAAASPRPFCRATSAFLVLTSVPVLHAWRWGQISLPLMVLVCWGLQRLAVQPWRAGWLLGLAAGLKVYPIAFAAPFAVRRGRRFFAAALVATAVVGLAVPAVVLGPLRVPGELQAAAERFQASRAEWVDENTSSQFLPFVLGRVTGRRGLASALSPVSVVLAGIWVVTLARAFQRGRLSAADTGALACASMPLWVPSAWPHYFCFLPWAQSRALAALADCHPDRRFTSAMMVGGSVLLGSAALLTLGGGWAAYAFAGVPAWASLLVGSSLWRSTRQPDGGRGTRPAPALSG